MITELQQPVEQELPAQPSFRASLSREPIPQVAGTSVASWCFWISMVFIGSLLRVVAVFQYHPLQILTSDPGRWWHEATHLFTPEPITAIDAFGYQLWLALVIRVGGTDGTAVVLHNALLSVLTPWVWHRLLREITADRDIALIGWAILCWLPSWISIYSYTMSETLFLLLLGAALCLTFRTRRLQSTSSFVLAALCWSLAASTRVFALPIAVVTMFWAQYGVSFRMRKLCTAALAVFILIIPLSVRSYSLLHVWAPFGLPQMNQIYMESGKRTLRFDIGRDSSNHWIYEFGSPALYEQPFSPLSQWSSSREGIVSFSINEDHGRADWNNALRDNRPSWRTRGHIWAENYIFFNFAPSWPDNNPDRFWDRAAVALRWMWVPIGLLATIAAFSYGRRLENDARLMVWVACASWLFTPLLPAVMEGRYRKPVEGMLIIASLLILGAMRSVRMRGSNSSVMQRT